MKQPDFKRSQNFSLSLSLLFLRILVFFQQPLVKISSHREEGISLADYRNPTGEK